MNELLRKRLERHLENLPDEQGYLLLDFVEFLEVRYGSGSRKPSTLERIAEGVEDALRAGRLPAAAIRETMSAMDTASRLMQRLAEAGRTAVDELGRPVAPPSGESPAAPAPTDTAAAATPPADEDRPPDSAPP